MRAFWIKLLLLSTFAFWATGTAKFTHELLEHHGGRDACVDDDGDDCATPLAAAPTPAGDHPQQPAHPGHPCPVCQMLGAMMVDRPPGVAVPHPSAAVVAVPAVFGQAELVVRLKFAPPHTGPPAGSRVRGSLGSRA